MKGKWEVTNVVSSENVVRFLWLLLKVLYERLARALFNILCLSSRTYAYPWRVEVAVTVEVTVEVEDEGEVTQSGEISTGRVELQFH